MKTAMALVCVLTGFVIFPISTATAIQLRSQDEALKTGFPEADSFKKKIIVMTREQHRRIKKLPDSKNARRIFKYIIAFQKGKVVGYAVVKTVWGKNASITFMVALNPDATVRQVQILTHAESPGKAIVQSGFLSQFKDKCAADAIRVGRDIDAVTGATISSYATADGVRQILARFSILVPGVAAGSIKLTALGSGAKSKGNK